MMVGSDVFPIEIISPSPFLGDISPIFRGFTLHQLWMNFKKLPRRVPVSKNHRWMGVEWGVLGGGGIPTFDSRHLAIKRSLKKPSSKLT